MVDSFFAFVICGCSDRFLATCNVAMRTPKTASIKDLSSPLGDVFFLLFALGEGEGRRYGRIYFRDIYTPE
jgi:hypothetical protein